MGLHPIECPVDEQFQLCTLQGGTFDESGLDTHHALSIAKQWEDNDAWFTSKCRS